jgi:hypothetical protein
MSRQLKEGGCLAFIVEGEFESGFACTWAIPPAFLAECSRDMRYLTLDLVKDIKLKDYVMILKLLPNDHVIYM